jgi:tetratricopeptide (TPR) repeat protein
MTDDHAGVSRWRNLRQHPAFQAAAVYIGGSWAVIQVADIFVPDPAVVRWLGIILAVGFLAVVGGAWFSAREGGQAPSDRAAAEEGVASNRWRRRLAYAAAACLVAIGGLFWWLRPNILGAVAPDAQVIAVLPFNTSGPAVEYLGEGVVDLLSPNFDEVGAIRTVDTRTVLHRWRQRAVEGSLDLEGALAVGRDVEAGSVVLGSVVTAGPEVRLRAQLYSVRGAELAQAQVEGPADSVLALLDELAVALLRKIWIAREPVPNLRVSGITTGNFDAIRAYLRGQQYYRRSNWDSAAAAFQRAVDADSTFALAHYRLGLTYGWNTRHGGFGSRAARTHAELAQRYSDRLPARERTLVAAHALFEEGRLAAYDSMVRYVSRHPDDPEGWYMLGDVRYHAMPILSIDVDDLFEPFDRILELDPSFAPAIIHPLELSLAYDDSARYFRFLDALAAAAEPSYVELYEIGGLQWTQPDSLGERLAAHPDANRVGGYMMAGSYRSETRTPADMFPGLQATLSSLEGNARTQVLSLYAMMLVSVGRLREASAIYDELWAEAVPNRQEPYLNVLPVLAGFADTSFAAQTLRALAGPATSARAEPLFRYIQMLYALSRGRTVEARELGRRSVESAAASNPTLTALISGAEGWADILDGDTVGGLAKLEAGLADAGYVSNVQLSLPLRYALAAIQANRPETREEGIRRLLNGWSFRDFVYMAHAYLLAGRALEASGDAAGAARAYEQFIHLWENADPELQPQVETARRALERLGAENVN